MIQQKIDEALGYAREFLPDGPILSNIPELCKANPKHIGVYIKTLDGQSFCGGDCQEKFTMQSVSKIFALIMALQNLGEQKVFSYVGYEASDDAFNSLAKLESSTFTPKNPFINSGAICVAGMLAGSVAFEDFLNLVKKACKSEQITLDEAVYQSEKNSGTKNKAIAYMLQNNNLLLSQTDVALDFYFKMCSTSLDLQSLANFAALLANGGVCPVSGQVIIENWIVKIVKSLMIIAGLYNESGEFFAKVGMPAKSGVSGCILAVAEGKMGVAVYSPAINDKGTSIAGRKLLCHMSNSLKLHCLF